MTKTQNQTIRVVGEINTDYNKLSAVFGKYKE